MAMVKLLLTILLILQSVANRSNGEKENTVEKEKTVEEAISSDDEFIHPGRRMIKLKLMVDSNALVCGSTEIQSLFKGDTSMGKQEEIYQAIQEIPWQRVEQISNDFIQKRHSTIEELNLHARHIEQRKKLIEEEEKWAPADLEKVNELLVKAVKAGFADPVYTDAIKLAKLTHCGSQRPNVSLWGPLPRKPQRKIWNSIIIPGTITVPGKMAATTNTIKFFTTAAEQLYIVQSGKETVYIDHHMLRQQCCAMFGLGTGCIRPSVFIIDDKCGDICAGIEAWVNTRNTVQGFNVAANGDSSVSMQNKLRGILDQVDKEQRELKQCEKNVQELTVFRKEVEDLKAEFDQMYRNYEVCRESLFDAEDKVLQTKLLLGKTGVRLEALKGGLSKGNTKQMLLAEMIEEATKRVKALEILLNKTKDELEVMNINLKKLAAANSVIMELQKKVSALLLQMVATFERVVSHRIQKTGFENIDAREILGHFPTNISELEGEEFEILGESIENMTTHCDEVHIAGNLSKIQEPNMTEFCSILKNYHPTRIRDQLQQAIQEHIDEYRTWFAKTAQSYQKFHMWLLPPEYKETDTFEPLGFQESLRVFQKTEFFKTYLQKWERKTGDFYKAYRRLLDNYGLWSDRQNALLGHLKETESQFTLQVEYLEKLFLAMKRLLTSLDTVGKDKVKEANSFDDLLALLKKLEADAKEKETLMEEAKRKFDQSWKLLIRFQEENKCGIPMIYEELMRNMLQNAGDQKYHIHISKKQTLVVNMHGIHGVGQQQNKYSGSWRASLQR